MLMLPLLVAGANYVIFSQRFSADPAPIVHDGRVYLYSKGRVQTRSMINPMLK